MSPAITDVPGVLVGHAQDLEALTGCTVVLTAEGAAGGVDVRGGAPGTRETDLLDPTAMVAVVHAIALCGGSAFGLAAATGVVEWLRERAIGFDTGVAKVPIVPAAVIFDLAIGRADRWADAAMGYAACAAAGATVAEGCVGAGAGATVGKLLGPAGAVKSGVGTWSETLADGTVIGALVVCNAWGDIYRQADGQIIAGTRDPQSGRLIDSMALLRQPALPGAQPAPCRRAKHHPGGDRHRRAAEQSRGDQAGPDGAGWAGARDPPGPYAIRRRHSLRARHRPACGASAGHPRRDRRRCAGPRDRAQRAGGDQYGRAAGGARPRSDVRVRASIMLSLYECTQL